MGLEPWDNSKKNKNYYKLKYFFLYIFLILQNN
jgi:hypothetical protein